MAENHRVEIDIDAGNLNAKLICPANGQGCKPAGYCEDCGRGMTDDEPQPERCENCPDPNRCNAAEWFDAIGAELLNGTITLPVSIAWEQDGPLVEIAAQEDPNV